MIQKKPFILLELLIAVSLVVSSALPLIYSPFAAMRTEANAIAMFELQRHAENGFAHIKQQLYCNDIPWKHLTYSKKEAPVLRQEIIQLDSLKQLSFIQKTRIYTLASKKGTDGEAYRLIAVEITFEPEQKKRAFEKKTYLNKIFVTNLPSTSVKTEAIKL